MTKNYHGSNEITTSGHTGHKVKRIAHLEFSSVEDLLNLGEKETNCVYYAP
jgi:hypothetical protein